MTALNAGVAIPRPGHSWRDFGQLAGKNVSWCSRCDALAFTGQELNGPCGVPAAQPIDRAAVFTIWQGMQYQGGIVTEAQAMQFAQQVLTAHGVEGVPK